jgi:hypothetical protein
MPNPSAIRFALNFTSLTTTTLEKEVSEGPQRITLEIGDR